LYRPKKVQPITPKQKTYLESLLLKHPFPLEKQITELTRSEASKIIDRIILQYGK